MPEGGSLSVRDPVEESPDPVRLGGISGVLNEQLDPRVESGIRTTVLGTCSAAARPPRSVPLAHPAGGSRWTRCPLRRAASVAASAAPASSKRPKTALPDPVRLA